MDFEHLKTNQTIINSQIDFETIVHWMENRFNGLPQFHTSIDIRVLKHERGVTKAKSELSLPIGIEKIASSRLLEDLNSVVATTNEKEGEKGFGLLFLRIKLNPKLLKHFLRRNCSSQPSLVGFLGTITSVPVVLALISRKSLNYYESLAFGIKGLTSYNSVLEVTKPGNHPYYSVKGGMCVSVKPENLDNFLLRKINPYLNSDHLINSYLQHYLVPEKPEIIQKLCEYTFNGCKTPYSYKDKIIKKVKMIPITN